MKLQTLGETLLVRFGAAPRPIYLTFEITHLCNLSCVYCDRHTKAPSEMAREQILNALDEFVTLGTRHVNLDGGEPLAHRDVDEIVAWLVERHIPVTMNTNGILIPRKVDTVRRLALVKLSLDGPPDSHDKMRGDGSFASAMRGAAVAFDVGVPVELTCVIGRHNAAGIDALLDIVERLGCQIVFQPARDSLFVGETRDASAFQLDRQTMRAAFRRIEAAKRAGRPVGNTWASLRHFRRFPDNIAISCAAGYVTATLDPTGRLFSCGQLARPADAPSVVTLGAKKAFRQLIREGCAQCWCARVVESNYAWGARADKFVRPIGTTG